MNTYSIPCLIYANLSELYSERGENEKALEAAKKAFDMEKTSMLPAFIYATRLSEAERYEDAVNALSFPRHAVNYREDVVELWVDCMRHVIEKSMAEERFRQAEEQCKHLLVIAPDDEFGRETLEKVREILKPKKDEPQDADAEAAPAA
jgi:tetratricopeptide (TPR) repeat protein